MRYLPLLIIFLCFSCKDEVLPKPKAYLRLEYPEAKYKEVSMPLPFTFERNELSNPISQVKVSRDKKSQGIDIEYPTLKGTIYITYKDVKENLELYLLDAQSITQKHTQRAEEIVEQPYINEERKVYGMFYEVGGNAASQSQFYVTDSINHFVTGSLYFYAKPNYDSILPAAEYLKNDIRQIMETIKWKE